MLWVILALMCLLAVGFAILPLTRSLPRTILVTGSTVVFVVGLSAGVYHYKGSPDVPSGAGQQPDVGAMVAALVERLEQQPDNLNGWKMLGRSYMTLGNYSGAIEAYEKAVQLEDASNAETLVSLGVALAQAGGQQLSQQAIAVFENALALAPNHPEALFWAGIGAFNRGDPALAADRWERLLATNPPEEVRAIIVARIATWRGETPPSAAGTTADPAPSQGPIVTVAISVSDDARTALPENASVFVIARDPKQPSPPIAVTRRLLSDLPGSVALGDQDAMIPGRLLSAFPRFELLVRASASGSPTEGPGDWYGSAIVQPSEQDSLNMSISEEVR
ncbi:MAG TPA: tetratricopeptide repeat protein [Woeseiaceae bacterium]|nr:tetratricopeptide repeat protein [Woeseiaceae bacterium]